MFSLLTQKMRLLALWHEEDLQRLRKFSPSDNTEQTRKQELFYKLAFHMHKSFSALKTPELVFTPFRENVSVVLLLLCFSPNSVLGIFVKYAA
jgi:hypothetical protein